MLRVRFYCGARNDTGVVPIDGYRHVMDAMSTNTPSTPALFDGYTAFDAFGVWHGRKEQSVVFEVIAALDKGDIVAVAKMLRIVGDQDAVLVTVEKLDDVIMVERS